MVPVTARVLATPPYDQPTTPEQHLRSDVAGGGAEPSVERRHLGPVEGGDLA
eukprot:CAMPEP_0118928012 /NCGR_PEP_ID=MMETSP1169-20130426/5367_1 /TAXON_ID=36882 /ORGANISM="Pyramimonas obovata, Strain CCMP722" /LENGTH=51 /DNA_ID=CAMNT_0006869899 /DNA_START=228 /DNA_END=380 /DNA_ORIENTATION=-